MSTAGVVGWGLGAYGHPPDAVNGVSGTATAIATGGRFESHGCAIQASTGNVVCWGYDGDGQATPPDAVNGVSGAATDIAAGEEHSCAIQAGTNSVICWGDNSNGKTAPSVGSATAVAAGDEHSCAIAAGTGNAVCWGSNIHPNFPPRTAPFIGQATPPDSVNGVSGNAIEIAAGKTHSCAIQAGTGNVVCWGDDYFRQGPSIEFIGQATPPASVNGTLGTATAVVAGEYHSCAIQASTGEVVCWGRNHVGQAAPPDAVNGVSGTAIAVSAGEHHSCAIQSGTDEVVCWGSDSRSKATPPDAVNGTSGTATAIAAGVDESCAIQSGTNKVVCWGGLNQFTQATPPHAVNGVSGIAADIAGGTLHSCAIQAGTGAVVCWGSDDDGTGLGIHFGQATPPASVNGTSGSAIDIAAGALHSCAIQQVPGGMGVGNVVCWGSDYLVTGSGLEYVGQATPPDSVNGTSGTATAIAADVGGYFGHSCAIQAGTGNVVCWGANIGLSPRGGPEYVGQSVPPDDVNGVSGTATAIALGASHSCAIQAGTDHVICWGNLIASSPPDAVNGVSGTASAIAAGGHQSCAIQSGTDRVVCWGDVPDPVPDEVNGTLGTASAIALGRRHSCAIQSGTDHVICWSRFGSGGQYEQGIPPDSVNGTSGTASAIAAGENHSLAIVTEPSIDGASGAVGDGGGTVSTGGPATAEDPLETSATVPAGTGGGTVVISETNPTGIPPFGFSFFGQQVNISAPSASVANPLILTFSLHTSIAGTDPDAVPIFKDSVLVGACTGAGATPDPCVESRALIGDNVQIVVRTSTASAWNFGQPVSDCLCEVREINPNQVVLQNVSTGGKGSTGTRKMVVVYGAVDAPGATCDPGEKSNPTPVNLRMEDDRGNVLIDSAKNVVCEHGETKNVMRDVFFQGPLHCDNGALPPPKPDYSLGAITSTGSAFGAADYVESTRIKCFE